MDSDRQQTFAEARQFLADEMQHYAIEALVPVLADVTRPLSAEEWQALLAILRDAFVGLDDGAVKVYEPLIATIDRFAAAPEDAEGALRLGGALIERKHAALASGVLARAWALHPSRIELLHELVASLELQGRYRDAVDALRGPAAESASLFLTRYLFAFNALVAGDVVTSERVLRGLDPRRDHRFEFMTARLEDMLQRARLLGTIATARDRQFVFSGTLLLDEAIAPAREDSWATLGAQLVKLRAVLAAIDRMPSRAVSLHGARKDALGYAASTIFAVPFAQQYLPDGEGLFVSDDLAAHQPDIAAALRDHRPRQMYYAHYATTDRELPVAADVIGTRGGDDVISPWDLWSRLDYTRADRPSGPPTESAEELGAKIVASVTAVDGTVLAALVAFATRAHEAGLLALSQERGVRERLWAWPRGA